jgi:hypothetical protein
MGQHAIPLSDIALKNIKQWSNKNSVTFEVIWHIIVKNKGVLYKGIEEDKYQKDK